MPRRSTETQAEWAQRRDEWMQRRIRYFGKPCLTVQEYRAVVFSLLGLPQVQRDKATGTVQVPLEAPTQRFVGLKLGGISQSRVSRLLSSAADALEWFDDSGYTGIGWYWRRSRWEFVAPVMNKPGRELRRAQVKLVTDHSRRSYKVKFAGEL